MQELYNRITSLYQASNRHEAVELIKNTFNLNDINSVFEFTFKYLRGLKDKKLELMVLEDLYGLVKDVSFYCKYAKVLLEYGEKTKSFDVYEKALDLDPLNVIAINGYCRVLVSLGNYDKAYEIFNGNVNVTLGGRRNLTILGRAFSKSGQHKRAIEVFERALLEDPEDVVVLSLFGNVLSKAGKHERAINMFKRALQIDYKDVRTMNACAKALVDAGKFDLALKMFEHALKIEPNNVIVLTTYGNILSKAGNLEKASEMFEQAIKVQPDNIHTLSNYGEALSKSKRFKKSYEIFEYALSIDPNNIFILTNYGNALLDSELNEKACEIFERALVVKPLDIIALNGYSKALAAIGNNEKVCEVYEQLIGREPNNYRAISNYYRVLNILGLNNKANNILERCVANNSDDFIFISSLCNVLSDLGLHNTACEVYENALLLKPNNITLLQNYIKVLYKGDMFQKAIEVIERLISEEPDNARTFVTYGKILQKIGRDEKSFEMFRRAILIEPENVVIMGNYGSFLADNGQHDTACEVADRMIMLAPENPFTQATAGVIFSKGGRSDKAISSFEHSLSLKPGSVVTLTNYAKLLLHIGRPQESVEKLVKAMALDPFDRVTLFLCGIAYQYVQEYERAIQVLEEYERLGSDPNSPETLNIVYLMLGRLCYLRHNEVKGNHYFGKVLDLYHSTDVGRLKTAMSILSIRPDSEEAIKILRQVTEDSPWYKQAIKILSLNFNSMDFFIQHENEESDYNLDLLNKALYHKIQNEISLLKGIVHELLADFPSSEEVGHRVLYLIEWLLREIKTRRADQSARIKMVSSGDYRELVKAISSTAHDISDLVNNEMAVIKGEILFGMPSVKDKTPLFKKMSELLLQVDITQAALNELKSINESVRLRNTEFFIRDLFKTWINNPKIENATIEVLIDGGDSIFYGDENKIRGFIGELVENSIKHNPDKKNLFIQIRSSIVEKLPDDMEYRLSKKYRIAGDREWLEISVQDNGKGIPKERKDWIFLPLMTTYPGSSGLGLFIIRRTLREMRGYIREKGQGGVHFEVFIPRMNSLA